MSEIQIAPSPTPTRRRHSRDQRVKRVRRQLTAAWPHLDDARYAPLVGSYARISLLVLDSYEFLRTNGLIGLDGELKSSALTVSRLITVQAKIAQQLAISPTSTLDGADRAGSLDAVYARIEKIRKVSEQKDTDGAESTPRKE